MIDRRTLLAAGCAVGLQSIMGDARAASSPQWLPLFDGRTTGGWAYFQGGREQKPPPGHLRAGAGELHFLNDVEAVSEPVPFAYLATDRAFQNYQLQLDYRWGERRYPPRALAKRNSGIMYHLSPDPDPARESAVEFQIQESNVGDIVAINMRGLEAPAPGGTPSWPAWPSWMPRDYAAPSRNGGVSRQWFRSAGDFERRDSWNRLDIIAFGDQAAHLVNGRIVSAIFGLRHSTQTGGTSDAPANSGRIALQIEAAEILFRTIRLRQINSPMDVLL